MPGVPLDIEYPASTDPLSTAFPQIITALQTLETDAEAPVTAAELDINANLDFAGYRAVDVGVMSMAAVPDTSGYPAGTIMYDGSEWYLNTSSGTVQVTLAGSLNAAALGGIVGDYGGLNPAAVTFVDASNVYRFTEDTGSYSDLEAEDLLLHGSAAGVMTLTTTLTTDKTLTVADGSLPGSGTAVLGITSAGAIVASPTVTNAFTINNADLVLAGTAEIQHPNKILLDYFTVDATNDATAGQTIPLYTVGATGGGLRGGTSPDVVYHFIRGLVVGDRVKTISIQRASTAAGGTDTTDAEWVVYKISANNTETSIGTASDTNLPGGANLSTLTIDVTDTTLTAGDMIVIELEYAFGSVRTGSVFVTYDHP